MQFQNRDTFIKAVASEKITLVHIDAKTRAYVFDGPVSNIYSKFVPYFVSGLKQSDQELTKVESQAAVIEGTFFYDIQTSIVYFRPFSDADPQSVEMIVTYRFFYADKGLTTSHDLADISEDVFYDGRFISGPGYKHKIGIDQALTSLVGEGTLALHNEDGGLDDIFDKLIFENQLVTIYTWNTDLNPSDARVIYRGRVTNKTYDTNQVKFKVKDEIFSLLDAPQMAAYTAQDNVSQSAQGQYKRRVYGRVDGLKCQSVDQIGDGFTLTGSLTIASNSTQLLGSGTLFLSEVSQNDKIIVGTQEFTVERVESNSVITTTDESDFGFSGQLGVNSPDRGTAVKNRTFLATGHECAEVTRQIVSVPQFNRFVVDNTNGLFAGDFVEFLDTSERLEIKNVAPGNIVVLQQNMVTKPGNGTYIKRQPIQEVYIGNKRVNADDYTINNTGGECGLSLTADAEFNLANPKNTVFSGSFATGSRVVNITTTEVSLSDVFQPGDWVKPDDITYTTFYRVVNVNDTSLDLESPFVEAPISDVIELISPEYIEDDTVVSVNILGKTVDGTATGEWIQTAPQVHVDLLSDVGITDINTQSFVDGEVDAWQLVSMAIPYSFNSKTLPTVKDIVDRLNKSVRGSLTLDNNLLIKFQTLNVYTGENLVEIKDNDVIDWKITATNGKTYRTAQVRYRFKDVDLATLEEGNNFVSHESEFVKRYIGTTKIDELDLYIYDDTAAKILARRHLYYNQLGTATLTLKSDLRLENVEIGDVVIANFERLYKRFGDSAVNKKTMLVVGKTVTGESTDFVLSDLGNTFNTSSYITPNDASEYNVADENDKLIYGYITDNQGIVDNDEDTAGVHLIS